MLSPRYPAPKPKAPAKPVIGANNFNGPGAPTNRQQIAGQNKYLKSPQATKDAPKIRAAEAELAAQHVKNMQQFLKNRGYNITVDGIRGPETNKIVAAFHNHLTPAQLAAQTKLSAKVTGTRPPTSGPAPRVTGGGGKGGSKPVIPSRSPASVTPGADDPYAIDPNKYAQSAANAAYDPQIAALQQQLNQLDPQHTQNIADISGWFQGVQNQDQSNINATQAFDKTNAAGYDTAAQNIASLFGGAAAPEFAGYADIGKAQLGANADSQNAFQSNLKSILGLQGADALKQELGMYTHNKADLLSQIGAQRSAKGQAYTDALQEGYKMAQDARTAQQSLSLAQSLAPYQIKEAKASAAAAQANASGAKAQAAANLALTNANIQKAQAASNGGQWNLNDPSDRGSLSQAIRTSIGNSSGWLRVSPQIALQNIQQALDQAGLSSDPQAQEIAKSVFEEVLNNSHSAKLFRNVQFVNGQLVVKPKGKTKK